MFRIDQILSVTTFLRTFKEVAHRLYSNPEPLLITQRSGRFIVVMDGDLFQELLDARYEAEERRRGLQTQASQ